MDELEHYSKLALLEKAKEMNLQGRHNIKKKELIELIRNPPSPRARSTGMRRKVILYPVDSEEVKLVFPTITAAAKHFIINPGKFEMKVSPKKRRDKKLDWD